MNRDTDAKEYRAILSLESFIFISIGEAIMANTPPPPRSKVRSLIPNRMCTKPVNNASEKMEGVNTDNFSEYFFRSIKNTTTEIETEINKICILLKTEEASASPCAEATDAEWTKTVNENKEIIILLFILSISKLRPR